MTFRRNISRIAFLTSVALGGALLSVFDLAANSQTPAQTPAALPATQPASGSPPVTEKDWQDWPGQRFVYDQLMNLVFNDQWHFDHDEAEGRPAYRKLEWCKILAIRKDEEQTMLAILLEGAERHEALGAVAVTRLEAERRGEHPPRLDKVARGREYEEIARSTIASLKAALSPETYAKLNAYVYDMRPRNLVTLNPPRPASGSHSGR